MVTIEMLWRDGSHTKPGKGCAVDKFIMSVVQICVVAMVCRNDQCFAILISLFEDLKPHEQCYM